MDEIYIDDHMVASDALETKPSLQPKATDQFSPPTWQMSNSYKFDNIQRVGISLLQRSEIRTSSKCSKEMFFRSLNYSFDTQQ